jgi:hypothetical protein
MRTFPRLPHAVAALGIALGGIWVWLKTHCADLFFAFAVVNAVGALLLSAYPDSAAAWALGLHAWDVTEAGTSLSDSHPTGGMSSAAAISPVGPSAAGGRP